MYSMVQEKHTKTPNTTPSKNTGKTVSEWSKKEKKNRFEKVITQIIPLETKKNNHWEL